MSDRENMMVAPMEETEMDLDMRRYAGTSDLAVISLSLNLPLPSRRFESQALRLLEEGRSRLKAALLSIGATIIQRQTDSSCPYRDIWMVKGVSLRIANLCKQIQMTEDVGRFFKLNWSITERCGDSYSDKLAGFGCPDQTADDSLPWQAPGVQRKITAFFRKKDASRFALLAVRALLYEVCTTPKPGLVDRLNNGSHDDMTLFTFLDSTTALIPYFEAAVQLGQKTAQLLSQETFRRLRMLGARAEEEMYRSTSGVNTHKGAIFTLGTVCAAAGRLWSLETPVGSVNKILEECAKMCGQAIQKDFERAAKKNVHTKGEKLYLEHGIEGIRGELSRGLPAVREIGLPILTKEMAAGSDWEQAGVSALVHMIAKVVDTNLIARGGLEGQAWAVEQAMKQLEEGRCCAAQAAVLDEKFIARHLSPGGCADLLAVTYFCAFLQREFIWKEGEESGKV